MAVLSLVPPAVHSAEAKVGDLQPALSADEQVGRLQIPVHDVLAVQKGHPLQQHLHVALHLAAEVFSIQI